MICLDTHVLLWWALDREKLSNRAAELCREMELRGGGCASAISIWELGVKIQKGALEIGVKIEDFARLIHQSGAIELVPVTDAILLANLALDWTHRDPADRTIVATARLRNVPLLTKDRIIHDYAPAGAVW